MRPVNNYELTVPAILLSLRIVHENFNDLDWDRFNSRGKVLHENLQAIVKNDYIVVYTMSFEEQYCSFNG